MSPFFVSPIGTILIVALSGFLMGFDGSLFTGAVVFVKGQFGLSDLELGWTVSSHTLTATLSIFLAGPLADRIGRRTVLRFAAIAFAASAIVAAAASSYAMLIVARLLSGLGVGSVLVAAPMYIAEISPPALRGRMVTINQLFLVLGIFLASGSNLLIIRLENFQFDWLLQLHLAESNWRWMLGIGAIARGALHVRAALRSREPALARHARATSTRRAAFSRARMARRSPSVSSPRCPPRWRTRHARAMPGCAICGCPNFVACCSSGWWSASCSRSPASTRCSPTRP